jgi:hypothetical protein
VTFLSTPLDTGVGGWYLGSVDNSGTPKEGNMPRTYGLEPDDPRYEDHMREWEGERAMNRGRCSCGSPTCEVDR